MIPPDPVSGLLRLLPARRAICGRGPPKPEGTGAPRSSNRAWARRVRARVHRGDDPGNSDDRKAGARDAAAGRPATTAHARRPAGLGRHPLALPRRSGPALPVTGPASRSRLADLAGASGPAGPPIPARQAPSVTSNYCVGAIVGQSGSGPRGLMGGGRPRRTTSGNRRCRPGRVLRLPTGRCAWRGSRIRRHDLQPGEEPLDLLAGTRVDARWWNPRLTHAASLRSG